MTPEGTFPCKVDILRKRDSKLQNYIEVMVEDCASKTIFCVLTFTLEQFALSAIGNVGNVDCDATLYNLGLIGKRREHKREIVLMPKDERGPKREEAAAVIAVAAHEVDGWKGRAGDATNWHNRKPEYDTDTHYAYEVIYVRYVGADEETVGVVE